MEQALICLIDNAVKHSPPGGVIELSWHDDGSETVIMVRDQGPGIASGDMERLFRRFGRLQQTIGQSHGGVGLGLYIARRLVEAMDGRIWAESERGTGSAFCIAVPRSHE
jgi:signal transduction histidine kinase